MAYTIRGGQIGCQPIEDASTTKKHELGTVVQAYDTTYGEGTFVYVQGVASCATHDALMINPDDYSTTRAVANAKGQFGVAMAALTASTYGWACIQGKTYVTSGTVLDNGDVFLTSTAGTLDDAVVGGDLVFKAKFASANGTPSSGLAEIELDHPYTLNGGVLDSTEVTATGTELNYLDIASLGTGAASKAVVLDGSSNWTSPGAGTVTFASGAALTCASGSTLTAAGTANMSGTFQIGGTTVSATAAELNATSDVSGRIVNLAASSLAVTAATHGERIICLNHTGEASTVTLPAATGTGNIYRFIVGAVNTSNHVIRVASASDIMQGNIITNSTGDTPDLAQPWPTAADSDTITLNGTTTGGQAVGDYIELIDFASGKWCVFGITTSSGTEATPFSAAVS